MLIHPNIPGISPHLVKMHYFLFLSYFYIIFSTPNNCRIHIVHTEYLPAQTTLWATE